ncbi:MAG: alpha/beta fold hydrolase [Opitutaceae bacterium]
MYNSRASELPTDVRVEYPFASNLFEVSDGVQMHFVDEGTGPVVLMLHGNPTWSFYYRNLVKLLVAKGYRCIVPDHIGCGLSDKPQDYAYTLGQRIEDVSKLIDHLGVDRFSLIVHDWGGAIGCGLAGRRPDAVEKIVLLNTAAFLSKRIPLRIASIKIPFIGEGVIRGLNGFAGPAAVMSVTKPLTNTVKNGMLWPYRSWADRVAVWNFVKDIPLREAHTTHATLAEVESNLTKLADKDIQIVWGGKDFCFNMHFYKRWQSIFPNAENQLFPQHGHYILEDGGDEVWTRIIDFICS